MRLLDQSIAVYKGDTFITSGYPVEVAKELSVKVSTVLFYMSPAYSRRVNESKHRLEVIKLD